MREQGIIKWFNHEKGYGFVKGGEHEYFVHFSAAPKEIQGQLNAGQEISFKLIKGYHGQQAAEVRLGGEDAKPKVNKDDKTSDADDKTSDDAGLESSENDTNDSDESQE